MIAYIPRITTFVYSTAQTGSSIIYSFFMRAARVSDFVFNIFPSDNVFEMAQGCLMVAGGLGVICKAGRLRPHYKFPAMITGATMIGCGVYFILDSTGRMLTGNAGANLQHRHVERIELPKDTCRIKDRPIFRQQCPKKGWVVCHAAGGGGDIGHCISLFNMFVNRFPQADMRLAAPADKYSFMKKTFPKSIWTKTTFYSHFNDSLNQEGNIAVHCPFIANAEEIITLGEKLKQIPVKRMLLFEFDYVGAAKTLQNWFPQVISVSSGADPDSIGMPFNLARFKHLSRCTTAKCRLTNLQLLPFSFQQAILGQPYSDKAVDAFHERASLFPSYAQVPASKDGFIATITQFLKQTNDKRSPYFVFLGSETPYALTTIKGIAPKERAIFREMAKNGFSQVNVLNFTDFQKPQNKSFSISKSSGTTVNMLLMPHMPNFNFKTLLASGRVAQGTGDISALEILEAGVPPIYEGLHLKYPFAKALIETANPLKQGIKEIVHPLFSEIREGGTEVDTINYHKHHSKDDVHWKPKIIDRLVNALIRIETHPEKWHDFVRNLIMNHSYESRVNKLVSPFLD